MADPSPPPNPSVVVFVLLLLIASTAAVGVSSTANSIEITFALEALRNHDYTLFANAIATSDLQELLTTVSAADENGLMTPFTLFAPKDDSLFALDMATDAVVYVNTLRYHSVPNHRLSFADLLNLSSPILDTLLPHYAIFVGRNLDNVYENTAVGVMVNGVRVTNPDIFLGSRIAVHGIDGILLSGLNVHQDFGDSSPQVKSPAPGPQRNNVPPAPAPTYGWSNVPGAPDGNIPAPAAPTLQYRIEILKTTS